MIRHQGFFARRTVGEGNTMTVILEDAPIPTRLDLSDLSAKPPQQVRQVRTYKRIDVGGAEPRYVFVSEHYEY